jgi:hypothetical protein
LHPSLLIRRGTLLNEAIGRIHPSCEKLDRENVVRPKRVLNNEGHTLNTIGRIAMSTTEEIQLRVDFVSRCILKRLRKPLIKARWRMEFKNEQTGQPFGDSVFLSDFKSAMQLIRETNNELSISDRTKIAVQAREEIIRKAHDEGKLHLALSAEKDLAELEGLYKQDKNAGTTFVLDFGGLPEAPSDDGPVPEEMLAQFQTEEDNEDSSGD